MIGKYASWAAIVLSAFLIVATGAWLYIETTWRASVITDDPAGAFAHRSIGLEAFPVKYAAVMQTLSAGQIKKCFVDRYGLYGRC